jgi:purine-binding chemotaxis protein CheW
MEKSSALGEARAGKYLTFQLGGESYGLEILKVQEIIGIMKITRIPRTPESIRGVINLRGKVIPVADLRLKFGMAALTDTEKTCIIVVRAGCEGLPVTMGISVDEVSEVLNVKEEQIEPAPSFGAAVNTEFILGVGKIGQKVLTLLDIDQVLAGGEVAQVAETHVGM